MPATTPEAKAMALSKLGTAPAPQESQPAEGSKQPQLSREIQSKEVLKTTDAPATEKPDSSKTSGYEAPKAKTTAVEAKSAPPAERVAPKSEAPESPVVNTPSSQAIQECLARSNTAEIMEAQIENAGKKALPAVAPEPTSAPESKTKDKGEGKPKDTGERKDATAVTNPPTGEGQGESDSESESSEELRRKEERVRVKKEAHARYMRFSRSLTSTLSRLV